MYVTFSCCNYLRFELILITQGTVGLFDLQGSITFFKNLQFYWDVL